MVLTYGTQVTKDADKLLLEQARISLSVTSGAMRLDECELWYLRGQRGRITTWGDGSGYLLHLYARSRKAWTYAKKRLFFATCTQDGDGEGVLRFDLPVTKEQAAEIRELTGLYQERSEETRQAASERAKRVGFGARAAKEEPAKDIPPWPRVQGASTSFFAAPGDEGASDV